MSMFLQRFLAVALVAITASLAACASSPERRQMAEQELAIYERHAGEPVERIRSFRMRSWQPVGDHSLLLENRLNEWYLIDVAGPCTGLRFAPVIVVPTTTNMLQSRFDYIQVEGLPCRIEQIRPIDARAARAEVRDLRRPG